MSAETFEILQYSSCKQAVCKEKTVMSRFGDMLVFNIIFRRWVERYRSRQALAKLDDHLLADVGLSRADVSAEIAKPFWIK